MNRTYPTLDAEHRAALQAFADAHGKNWKSELGDVYWYNARIWRGPVEGMGTALHNIRNNFGPTWLWDICDVKPTPKPKKAKLEVGAIVAFNTLSDAAWFDVLEIDGMRLTLREHGTDYAKQYSDKSLVKQIRKGA